MFLEQYESFYRGARLGTVLAIVFGVTTALLITIGIIAKLMWKKFNKDIAPIENIF